MGFDQYHEPADELSAETRTFARMIASLTEEAEAIGWYEQRMSLEPDKQAKAIMESAQAEEFKRFGAWTLSSCCAACPSGASPYRRSSSPKETSSRTARRQRTRRASDRVAVTPYCVT